MESHGVLQDSDPPNSLAPDRMSALRAAGLTDRDPVFCRQVHSNRVFVTHEPGLAGEGDALVTDRFNLALCIQTADCVPVYLVAPEEGAVALVHAGWRGTSRGIIPNAMERLKALDGVNLHTLEVFLGPSIRSCCYEVGPEVASLFDPLAVSSNQGDRVRLDLPGSIRHQLEEGGVNPSRISEDGRCTSCDPEGFHSYRRDGKKSGRMICLLALKEIR